MTNLSDYTEGVAEIIQSHNKDITPEQALKIADDVVEFLEFSMDDDDDAFLFDDGDILGELEPF